ASCSLGHAEGRELRAADRRAVGEERGVRRVRAGPAALDIVDAECIQRQRDLTLVLDGEVDTLRLRAVAQRRVENEKALLHRFTSQVVPSGPSFRTIPLAASSSRIRSEREKSFAFRAALRFSIACAISASFTWTRGAIFSRL